MKPSEALLSELRVQAVQAASHSYSPYSHFPVGAAVASASGRVYAGCNVENVSFGLTQCAERAALTAAIAAGEKRGDLTCMVLYIPGDVIHAPCGACRQVISELMAPDSVLYSCCDEAPPRFWSASDFLPYAVSKESMGL